MIDTYKIYEELKEDISDSAARKIASLIGSIHDEFQHLVVTREELSELKEAVKELILAHKSAEERLTRLESTVAELAEVQKKTEQRLNELAEAQKRTEEELRKLIGEHKKTREKVVGISRIVCCILEDRAYRGLPELLKRDFGVQTLNLKRDFIEIAPKKYEEINIFGEAQKDGKRFWIIGDCKTQLKKRDIDDFLGFVKKIDRFIKGEKILLSVTYQTPPPVRAYAQEKGVKIYFSYEMPL